jgi:WD40 repeat protein
MGVLGSVGANVLTTVVMDAIARARAASDDGTLSPALVERALAERIEAAFRAGGSVDRDLRAEVIGVFEAVDVAGTALQAAAEMEDEKLAPAMAGAFAELAGMFGEFAFVLVTVRLRLEGLHQEVRREVARQSVDRERAQMAEADIRRILDLVRNLSIDHGPVTADGNEPDMGPRWVGSPYLGLLPFEERHTTVFFGRRAVTSRLVGRLAEQLSGGGILLVLGPSGAGKSSLLRAGLAAAIADDRLLPGSRTWPRRVMTPTVDPMRQLATHLADLIGTDAIGVYDSLTRHPERAHLLAAQALANRSVAQPPGGGGVEVSRLVLIVDQFEELFTLGADPELQTAFVAALDALASSPALPDGDPAAVVVAGMRGDFLDQAAAFGPLRESVEAGPFTVGAMSESDLREAVTGPAAEAGLRVPDEVTDLILDDLRDRNLPVGFDSGALPLLSQVLFVMWQADPAHRLTVEGYRRTGGVATIAHTSAERVYGALSEDQRVVARRVFVHLADVADGRLTRRPATRAALRTAAGGERYLELVLEAFTRQRLITRSDNDVVEIAHEELLHSWHRLRDWVQPDPTDQALHRALVDDVRAWQDHNRDQSYLYRGGQLLAVQDAARRWATGQTHHLAVDQAAMHFLEASKRRDHRRRNIIRAVTSAFAVLLLAVVGVAVVAVNNATRADQQHALALSRQFAAQSRTTRTTQPLTSRRLAAAALRTAPTVEAAAEASAALADYRNTLPVETGVSAVVFSPDGSRLATGSDHIVQMWDPATNTPVGGPLAGHIGPVFEVVFSPDGELLATGSGDGTVRLWDAISDAPVGRPLAGHTDSVNAMVFSPDGKRLATGSGDGTVRLWDPISGTPVGVPLTGHDNAVFEVVFSPDGKLLATSGSDGTVRLWDPTSGTPVGAPLTGYHDGVLAVAFSPDGKLLAIGGDDRNGGTVWLWDPVTGKPVGEPLTGHTGPVNHVVFSPDGKLLASASDDGTVRLWDPISGTPVGVPLTGHDNAVYEVVFRPDGKLLATRGNDGGVRLWDSVTGRPVGGPLTGHTWVNVVVFSPDGKLLATGGDNGDGGTVRLWDPVTGEPVGAPLTGHTWANEVIFSPDGGFLAAGIGDGTVRLWDPVTGKPVGAPLTGHNGAVFAVAFSPNGKLLAAGSDGGTVRLWDPFTGKPVGEPLTGHIGPVSEVVFTPDGKLLATRGNDDAVRLWDSVTGEPVGGSLTGHVESVNVVVVSPYGNRLVTHSGDDMVQLWDLVTGKPVGEPLTGHSTTGFDAAFSPDGKVLVTSDDGDGGNVRLWDSITGKPISGPLRGHTWVNEMAFSPDGKLLAVGGGDGAVRLWDPVTGKSVGVPLTGHVGAVFDVAFSPDGKLLAVGGDDGAVRLWDPVTGKSVGVPLTGHVGAVFDVIFSPDGKLLATRGNDGTVRLWEPSLYIDPVRILCAQAGSLNEEEWAEYAAGEPYASMCS